MARNYDNIIFDIDGTLIDTEKTGALSLIQTVRELLGREMPYDEAYSYFGIPSGKVATYGQIACLCGSPRASRAVGYALHFNPDPEHIPCFRVVNRFGKCAPAFAFGGADVQANLLRADGVEVDENGYVDLGKYQWIGY